ncbi:MAG: hypothetical protein H0X49_13325 [Acidobacteria bacterium]|nr:hypothetical protein [Acidobacteriota bacterium]
MALITLAAETIENWRLAGDFELRVYSQQTWITEAGETVPGTEENPEVAYFRVACSYNQTAKVLTIPAITLPSTTDSRNNRRARYSIAGIYDASDCLVFAVLRDFRVFHDFINSIAWGDLRIQNEAKFIPRAEETYYNINQIHSLIRRMILQLCVEYLLDEDGTDLMDDDGAFLLDR